MKKLLVALGKILICFPKCQIFFFMALKRVSPEHHRGPPPPGLADLFTLVMAFPASSALPHLVALCSCHIPHNPPEQLPFLQ